MWKDEPCEVSSGYDHSGKSGHCFPSLHCIVSFELNFLTVSVMLYCLDQRDVVVSIKHFYVNVCSLINEKLNGRSVYFFQDR